MSKNKKHKKPIPQIIGWCEKTNTIRALPSNCLIAHKVDERWVCDADSGAPYHLVKRVLAAVHLNHDIKYGTGLMVLAKVTPNPPYAKRSRDNVNIVDLYMHLDLANDRNKDREDASWFAHMSQSVLEYNDEHSTNYCETDTVHQWSANRAEFEKLSEVAGPEGEDRRAGMIPVEDLK